MRTLTMFALFLGMLVGTPVLTLARQVSDSTRAEILPPTWASALAPSVSFLDAPPLFGGPPSPFSGFRERNGPADRDASAALWSAFVLGGVDGVFGTWFLEEECHVPPDGSRTVCAPRRGPTGEPPSVPLGIAGWALGTFLGATRDLGGWRDFRRDLRRAPPWRGR
ncbi:MAG TPA: hypothetical protein VLA09_01425 [Longimicrobiales bacterium]|nr:hypothetical protein [Longimicrobiales bacterium]